MGAHKDTATAALERGVAGGMLRAGIHGLVVVLFVVALYFSALTGIELARRQLPASPAGGDSYPIGVSLDISASIEAPLVGGGERKLVRDYLFTLAAGTLGEQKGAFEDLLRLTEPVRVKTCDHDLDLVQVEVLSGESRGRVIWVPEKDLPNVGADGSGAEGEGTNL